MPQFAESSGIPATTLRFYEDAGRLHVERAPSASAPVQASPSATVR
ncbi:hypothetical protein ACIQI8_44310 [Streptomyces sp. NPDC092369]